MNFTIFIFIFLLGLSVGSFINCLVWRLHKEESILNRSYCPSCRHQIAWYDNIPLLSFILLRARCRHCHKPISWQYPVVELITGLLFVVAFYLNTIKFFADEEFLIFNFKFLISVIRDLFIIAVMIIVFIYDLRWYLILDIIVLPASLIVFLANVYLGLDWQNLLISGIIGSSFFLLQYVISRGKWIGGGDIRLGLLIGLALGYPMVILAIFIAYFIGSIIGIGLMATRKKTWGSEIPLGIFLSTATVITLFWGRQIMAWYFNLLGV